MQIARELNAVNGGNRLYRFGFNDKAILNKQIEAHSGNDYAFVWHLNQMLL